MLLNKALQQHMILSNKLSPQIKIFNLRKKKKETHTSDSTKYIIH